MLVWTRRLYTLALASVAACAPSVAHANEDGSRSVALKSGITMRYAVAGPAGGDPLLLLHGLGDTSRSWSLVLPTLARRHRVYVVDQRGHGQTEAPACCYALADFAGDAIGFLDAMKVEKAAVAGHSLGSFVAQYLATVYPQRVSRLVLMGSSDAPSESEAVAWLWSKAQAFEGRVSAEFVDEWQSNPTPVEASFLAKVKAETAAVPLQVWKGVARTLLAEDRRRFLREIRVPALILSGEKDPMFPPADQERLREALPNARLKVYPKVGHNLHWEIPAPVAEEMAAFLAR
jgi:pimeloyl-ACP methyl ester carboxylesterase